MILKPHLGARLNVSHPLSRGLIHAWIPLGEQAGVVRDLAQELDLTLNPSTGDIAFGTPGFAGHRISGTGTHRGAKNTSAPNVGPPFTVFVLVEVDALEANTFFAHDTGANSGYVLHGNNDDLRFTLGAVANYNTFLNVVSVGEPFLYAVRMDVDGGDIVAYHQVFGSGDDVSRVGVDVGNISGLGSLDEAKIAVARVLTESLEGHIYACLWWDRELSDAEIAQLFADPYAMFRRREPIELWSAASGAVPTPTPTETVTPTPTETVTPTPTETVTPTPTETVTPSPTPTETVTPSPTPTETVTPTPTETVTPTPTETVTPTPTETVTPSPTPTETVTPTPTPTETVTPTPTETVTPTPTETVTPTPTETVTPTPTETVTPTPTETVTPSPTPTETVTPSPTPTETVTPTPTETVTPTPTETVTPTPTETVTPTPTPTETVTPTPTPSPSPTPTPTPVTDPFIILSVTERQVMSTTEFRTVLSVGTGL